MIVTNVRAVSTMTYSIGPHEIPRFVETESEPNANVWVVAVYVIVCVIVDSVDGG